jgi:hypothetical protein
MAYTTPDKVRKILGVEIGDAPDEILNTFITDATKVVIRRLTVRVINEIPEQGYKTDNTEWYCLKDFIADVNGDKIINKDDIAVFKWENLGDESTKTQVDVLSLNPIGGRILLVDPIPTGYSITVDYSYYMNQIDFDMVDLAAAYWAARMWIERELMLVPQTVRIGRVTSKGYEYWNVCNQNFERIMHLLMEKSMDKVAYEKMVISARGLTMKEEATASQAEIESTDEGSCARDDSCPKCPG